jgi:two-component system, LytTR family, response regulator
MKPKKEETKTPKPQMSFEEYFQKNIQLPKKGPGTVYLPLRLVTYLEADGGKFHVHFDGLETRTMDRNISAMQDLFPEPHFYSVHESYIVNIHFVLEHIPGDGGTLIVKDNRGTVEIPVSREKKLITKAALDAQSITIPPKIVKKALKKVVVLLKKGKLKPKI